MVGSIFMLVSLNYAIEILFSAPGPTRTRLGLIETRVIILLLWATMILVEGLPITIKFLHFLALYYFYYFGLKARNNLSYSFSINFTIKSKLFVFRFITAVRIRTNLFGFFFFTADCCVISFERSIRWNNLFIITNFSKWLWVSSSVFGAILGL